MNGKRPTGARGGWMLYRFSADLVLLLHLAFVGFVLLGGLLVLRWPGWWKAHVPAVAWGALIEFAGWVCPLTPLEVLLRKRGGEAGYSGDFIDHYLTATLYPAGLTRNVQIAIGTAVLLGNLCFYAVLLVRRARSR